jgi:hypothetical protein
MNYDTRIAIAREWVGTLITRYERPAHLAHDKARLELSDMAEDLNAIIPSKLTAEEYRTILEKAARTIRSKNRTRSWPTIALVCQAIRENLPTPAPANQASAAPKSLDRTRSMVINAGRIKRREPVGECWITGNDADKLIAQKLIDRSRPQAIPGSPGRTGSRAAGRDRTRQRQARTRQRVEARACPQPG